MMPKIIKFIYCFLCFTACIKAPVDLRDTQTPDDPNITYIDSSTVNIATYMIDSFVTSGDSSFAIGFIKDSVFGTMNAATYFEVNIPFSNPVKDETVSFDSLVIILKPNGNYYGDTLLPVHFTVHKLAEQIQNDDGTNTYYNTTSFHSVGSLSGELQTVIKPQKDEEITIRLSDDFGKELLNKLQANSTTIQNNDNFTLYFPGIVIESDTADAKNIFYFNMANDSSIMRLHYHETKIFSEEKYLDFPINIFRHFNHITYNHIGTALDAFTPYKEQLVSSSLTGNRAYLHNNMGCLIKINFPTILSIKELHPYIKVLKAELVIKLAPGTYHYPFVLPDALSLYATDEYNHLNSVAASNVNPYIDDLYGENTGYTYEITSFIDELLNESKYTKTALMLYPAAGISDSATRRLVINNQQLDKSISLQLYVLGL